MSKRQSKVSAPALQDARTFLEVLTGESDPVMDFRAVPEAPGCKEYPRNYRGRASQILPLLAKKNDAGCGIFYVANRTDGEGRKKANMVAARVVPLDLDGADLPESFEREPDAIVETSPGKYHVLWTIAETDDFAAHKDIVKRTAAAYGGDKSVSDVTRILRMPGFSHMKTGKPFRSRLVKHADPASIAFERPELSDFDYLPPLPERSTDDDEDSAPSEGELTPELAAEILEQLDPDAFAVSNDGGDLDWRGLAMSLNDGSNGDPDVLEVFKEWCARDPEYATDEQQEEIESRWNSFSSKREGKRITLGSLLRLCEQHGVDSKLIDRVKFGKKTAAEDFEDDIPFSDDPADKSQPEDDKPTKRRDFTPTPVGWVDSRYAKRRQWLYAPFYARKFVSEAVAQYGTGKTTLALVESLCMVTGRPLLGVEPGESDLRVWVWNGEDPQEEMLRRWSGVLRHYKIKPEDIGDRFFLDSGRVLPIELAYMDGGTTKVAKPVVRGLIEAIREARIDVLHIDPFVSSHSVMENSNDSIQMVVKTWADIADRCNCSIALWHHPRKVARDTKATFEDGRGGSAANAAARGRAVINKMMKDEAAAAGIPSHERDYYMSIDYSGTSQIPPGESNRWFRLQSQPLFNRATPDDFDADGLFKGVFPEDFEGDSVGVAVPWEYREIMDADDPNNFEPDAGQEETARKLIREGGPWRKDIQSPRWIGRAIAQGFGLDPEKKGDRAKVRETIKGWTTAGLLEEYEDRDPDVRKNKPMLRLAGDYKKEAGEGAESA